MTMRTNMNSTRKIPFKKYATQKEETIFGQNARSEIYFHFVLCVKKWTKNDEYVDGGKNIANNSNKEMMAVAGQFLFKVRRFLSHTRLNSGRQRDAKFNRYVMTTGFSTNKCNGTKCQWKDFSSENISALYLPFAIDFFFRSLLSTDFDLQQFQFRLQFEKAISQESEGAKTTW